LNWLLSAIDFSAAQIASSLFQFSRGFFFLRSWAPSSAAPSGPSWPGPAMLQFRERFSRLLLLLIGFQEKQEMFCLNYC